MNVPIPTTASEWREEASEQRRRARNRLAQRNYRKNIKDRLKELELLRAQQSHVRVGDAEEPRSQRRVEGDGIKPREIEPGLEETPPLREIHQRPEPPEPMPARTKSDIEFAIQTQQLDKSPDLVWSDASALTPSLTPSLVHGLTLHDRLDPPSQVDLIKTGSTMSPGPWAELSNGAHNGNFSGRTPLHQAAVSGHTNVMQLLLARGASITAVDENGQTVLHLAAKHGHEGTVRYLLEQGVPVDSRNHQGSTALHLAAENGSEAIVEALLCAGACVDSMTHSF